MIEIKTGNLETTTKLINIGSIEIGERHRKDYGNLAEIKQSIKIDGLLHPIGVSLVEDHQPGKKKYNLIFGGRRLRAITELRTYEGQVEAKIFPALSLIESRTLELVENTQRKDLTWMEQVANTREIHELNLTIHGPIITGKTEYKMPDGSVKKPGDGWSQQKTADLLGTSSYTISKDIELAEAIEEAPEIFKGCKSKADADRALVVAKKTILHHEASNRETQNLSSSELKQSILSSYNIGDFFEGVKSVADNSVDLVEMDPPYGVNLTFGIKNLTSQQAKDLLSPDTCTPQEYEDFIRRSVAESYRVLKPGGWFILWFPVDPWWSMFKCILQESPFKFAGIPAIWTKLGGGPGVTRSPATNLGRAWEPFYYCRKGNAVIINQGAQDVFNFKMMGGAGKVHPTERPIELIEKILRTFVPQATSQICVPFLGSGNTILAAANMGCKAFGWEQSTEYKHDFQMKVLAHDPGDYSSYAK